MDLEPIKQEAMTLAKARHFGVKPEEIVVAEKMVLIHSELSEVFAASLNNNFDGKDGISEELADVLIRILHLGGVFQVNFGYLPEAPAEFLAADRDQQILRLHLIISEIWEDYRRGRLTEFKGRLLLAAASLIKLAEKFKIDLELAVTEKMRVNQSRDWQIEGKPNEKFIERRSIN